MIHTTEINEELLLVNLEVPHKDWQPRCRLQKVFCYGFFLRGFSGYLQTPPSKHFITKIDPCLNEATMVGKILKIGACSWEIIISGCVSMQPKLWIQKLSDLVCNKIASTYV